MKVINNQKMKIIMGITIITIILLSICIIFSFNITNEKYKEKIFNQYQFDINESVAIYELEKQIDFYIILAIVFVLFSIIILYVTSYILIKKEEEHLIKITKNIENISKRDYQFLIKEADKGSIGTFQDEIYKTIIRLQEYSNQIESDKKKLSIYLSDISHQLRTLLLSITILVDNLLENMTEFPEEERQLIYNMSVQIDKMKWLVDSLLKMAQLDTKSIILKKENINIRELLNIVEKNVEILLELKNQNIEIKGKDDICFIGDFKWNVEAITNIVKNAIEYSKEGETVNISYEKNVLYTTIIIEDKGKGISKEDLRYIFDRFYKGESSDKDSFGIGLSLAKQIISEQNGEIKVESKIDIGTKFIINYIND